MTKTLYAWKPAREAWRMEWRSALKPLVRIWLPGCILIVFAMGIVEPSGDRSRIENIIGGAFGLLLLTVIVVVGTALRPTYQITEHALRYPGICSWKWVTGYSFDQDQAGPSQRLVVYRRCGRPLRLLLPQEGPTEALIAALQGCGVREIDPAATVDGRK